MDIQQTDKESLAAYVHRFKWEANRCKFNNDATTIRIFLKGLKNAHTIATKVSLPDHFIDLHVIAPHATEAQVHAATAVTHHITDPHPHRNLLTTQIPQTTLQTSTRIFFKLTNNTLEK